MQPPTLLVLAMSCIIVLVTAETQSAHIASSKSAASHALAFKQRQQQQNNQPPQQPLSSRSSHLASDQQAVGGNIATNSAIPYLFTSSHTLGNDKSPNKLSSDVSSYLNSKGQVKNLKTEGQLQSSSFNNGFKNVRQSPINSVSYLSYKNELSNDVHNSEGNSLTPHDDSLSRGIQPDDHRVDKREVPDSSLASDGQTGLEFSDEEYPIYLDRRFQVFIPSNAPISTPYLSAQEFKETFRRSDPYFMGKRTTDLFDDKDQISSDDKGAAPKFVGRRAAPYFVGKRESQIDLDNYLARLAAEDDESPLLEDDKRDAPKFVGRRGAPYFVGKRTAPMFVGKRFPVLEVDDAVLLPSEEKRRAPIFVGKRELSNFAGKRWNELTTEDELNWLLENNNAVSKFVGRRGAPYFVGKRASPKFVGKRAGLFELDDEYPLLNDEGQLTNFLDRRGSPYFVGRRAAPKFIGKRWANPDLHNQDLAILEDKRGSPKFVGRRGSPYFVGKREPLNFEENEFSRVDEDKELLEDKRRAPKFVGRRGAPRFIGKRGRPMFIGKRVTHFDWADSSLSEDKRAAPKFVGRRGAPRFVGKRGAPRFVGKRGAPRFVGKRGAPRFVGRRGAPKFVGKRDFYLLNANSDKVRFGRDDEDVGHEPTEFMRRLLEENILSDDKSSTSGVEMDPGSEQKETQDRIHLQAIEDARIQESNTQGHAAVERTSDERFQKTVAEESNDHR